MAFDERELYMGLAALHWAATNDTDPRWDEAFFKRVIEENGGRALELGCGTGRLLLAYLEAGLTVDGVDISPDMLAVCREKAAARGLQPGLYEQPMQKLDLPQRYSTIYIPCGSFVLVMDRAEALETLRRCFEHLQPGGKMAFNIYLPEYEYVAAAEPDPFPGPWVPRAEKSLPAGRRLLVSRRATGVNRIEQIEMEERRYELYDGDMLVQQEVRLGRGRWYYRNELLWMLQLAGFSDVIVKGDYTDEEFGEKHTGTMVFLATR